jgi:hypothetical protein
MSGNEDGKDQAEDTESGATAAAKDVLHPAIPPGAAAIIAETDPRLNRPSETEAELEELVESNEAAEAEGMSEDKSESDPS